MTEQEARIAGRTAGYKSMRRGKRKSWSVDDAAVAVAEYRRLRKLPDATIEAGKAALTDLTGAVGSGNPKSRPSKRSKGSKK